MRKQLHSRKRAGLPIMAIVALASLLISCGSATQDSTSQDIPDPAAVEGTPALDADSGEQSATPSSTDDDHGHDHDDDDHDTTQSGAVDVSLFFEGALANDPTIEDCTLSGGTETTCYRLTVAGYPANGDTGPFCPTTITDENGGLWWDGNDVYDLTGEFIVGLAGLYNDDTWRLYDDDGNVNITETAEEFDLAARPNVDPSLQNHCVEGRLEWLDNGQPITTTVLIPTEPIAADTASSPRGTQGVTLNGVVIAEAAPVEAILGAYTIAAFDDCGGHYNPHDGYHLHGAVGCSELDQAAEGETSMFGYALDGYPIHSPYVSGEEPGDLDQCNGHSTEALGYHYHANAVAENQVVECLVGDTASGTQGGPGAQDGQQPPPAPGADDAMEDPATHAEADMDGLSSQRCELL